jgi:NAD(P)-dependent dehydrogenase (short-subunit alcohol dehydrogenase family)
MGQLDGKTAVVTGGSSGIGLATAVRLAAEGAHVFVTGRRKAELDAAVEVIGSATAVAGDISDPADLDRLYDAVRARGKGLDALFANAATASFATLDETTQEHFDQTFGVNVRGTLFTVQKALPLLNEGASIILNSSVRADDGVEAFGAYAASKAALRSYARTWANELKGRGIRVNVVSPGTIDGNLWGERPAAVREASFAQYSRDTVLHRVGRESEVADAVLYLFGNTYTTGSTLYPDGGYALR